MQKIESEYQALNEKNICKNRLTVFQRNDKLIREGSSSYAVFVTLKLIALTQVAGNLLSSLFFSSTKQCY